MLFATLTGGITDPSSFTDIFTTIISGATSLIPLMLKAPMIYYVGLGLLGGGAGLLLKFKRR